jgi:tRNA-uridine 2-sulfurtransferase
MKKVLVGISGGIDSFMSLYLLQKKGYLPVAVTFIFGTHEKKENSDIELAKKQTEFLNIEHKIINAEKEFENIVLSYYIDELQKNNTPNPCVVCNALCKFSLLEKTAKDLKIDFIATGHYAKAINGKLFKGKDILKDQSYFLSFLSKKTLKKTLFPLGNYLKKEIKEMALKKGFKEFKKTNESQDFCYFNNNNKEDFIKKYIPLKQGNIVLNNKVIGTHNGLANYTIGQRKGIKTHLGPIYVYDFDIENNNLIVTKDKNKLFKRLVKFKDIHFISKKPKFNLMFVKASIRYKDKASFGILNLKKQYV